MKSRNLRWYENHKNVIGTIFELICDAIPGSAPLKTGLKFLEANNSDKQNQEYEERLQALEGFFGDVKPFLNDIIDDVEHLKEFKNAKTLEEKCKAIRNSYIASDLAKAIPQVSSPIIASIQDFTSPSSPFYIPDIVGGKYILKDLIGSGSQGQIYKTIEERSNKEYAIKMIKQDIHTDETQRLQNEFITMQTKLIHPNIITYYDLGYCENKKQWYIIMDYIPGTNFRGSLHARKNNPFSLTEVHQYLSPIAEALAHAHNQGIVHCDLKPENILINNKTLKLTDFGLYYDSFKKNETNIIGGSIPYMAPEQLKKERLLPSTDTWAFGIIVYEMLTGRHPFTGPQNRNFEFQICNESPLPLKEYNTWNILRKAFEKDPTKRIKAPLLLINELKDSIKKEEPSFWSMFTSPPTQAELIQKQHDNYEQAVKYYNKKRYSDALRYFELSGKIKNSPYYLGRIYYDDFDVKQDFEKAYHYFKVSEQNGNPNAKKYLGLMYKMGQHVQADYDTAFKRLMDARKEGAEITAIHLAHMYEKGLGSLGTNVMDHLFDNNVTNYTELINFQTDYSKIEFIPRQQIGFINNPEKPIFDFPLTSNDTYIDNSSALKYYEYAANAGCPTAKLKLGFYYLTHPKLFNSIKDQDKYCHKLFTEGLKSNTTEMICSIGRAYYYSCFLGINPNKKFMERANHWIYKAGGPASERCLGYIYNAQLQYKNFAEITKSFFKFNTSSPNYESSQNNLTGPSELIDKKYYGDVFNFKNTIYSDQNNNTLIYYKDYAKAEQYYKYAIKDGDIDSLYQLGVLYAYRDDNKQNTDKAIELLTSATKHNHICAMNTLANLKKSEEIYWLEKAANLESIYAAYRLYTIYHNKSSSSSVCHNAKKYANMMLKIDNASPSLFQKHLFNFPELRCHLARGFKYY